MEINKIFISGNLTKDAELKYTKTGIALCTLNIASNRSYKKGDEWKTEVTFIKVNVWDSQGEICADQLQKGQPVIVEGRLDMNTWEKEGVKKSELFITAHTVKFILKPPKKENNEVPEPPGDNVDNENLPF
ncbi:MAG: single-stranded DNA-binding protein [Bacteroidetes bacterium]|nr:single-stranded DNA-binding protein [Bacteroidota bacterium]